MTRPIHFARRALISCLLMTNIGHLTGCANYSLNVPRPNSETKLHEASGTVYFWGLLEPKLVAKHCTGGPGAIGFVRARDHFGYDLLSVITLGIVKPMKLEYKCAASRISPGDLED